MPPIPNPTVHKMSPTDLAKIENPIDRIQAVKDVTRTGMVVSIYGEAKSGKTRLLSTFPKPLLIIGTEDGTGSISNVPDVDFVMIRKSADVSLLVDHAINSRKYKTVGLDNATFLQQFVLAEMLGMPEVPKQFPRGVMAGVDNQEYSAITKNTLAQLQRFAPYGNVVWLSHERDHTSKENKGIAPSLELMSPVVTSAVSKAVAIWLNGIADYVCQTFKRGKLEKVDDGVGGFIEQHTDKGEYCLRVGPHPIYMTGFRVPMGVELPDVIVDPSYAKMAQYAYGIVAPKAQVSVVKKV